jgi:broad specificity phosphatase PhoE
MGEIVLVRHGETEGESSIRLYGSTDVALSAVGREQMRRVGRVLGGETFDRVVTSPLGRSREGAEIVLGGRGPGPRVVGAFAEIDFGDWEGWTLEEARSRDPEAFSRYEEQGAAFRFPGGEDRAGFHARVAAAVPEVFSDTSEYVLGVLHKGVIKIILAELLGLSFSEYSGLPVELGSIHRVRFACGRWHGVGLASPGEEVTPHEDG